MIEKKTKKITKEETDWIYICDVCKKRIESENTLGTGEEQSYYHSESKIYYEDGNNYPEDGYEPKGESFIICGQCMKDKVFPLIEANFKIKRTKYDRYDSEDYYMRRSP